MIMLQPPELVGHSSISRRAQQNELAALTEAVVRGMSDKGQTFLMVKPADVTDDGFVGVAQPEALSQGGLVRILFIQAAGVVFAGDVPVGFRIPNFVIESIQNSTE